jgi:hypothetical protein
MTKTPTKRAVVPADIKAGRKLLDELAEARRELREMRREVDTANRTATRAVRELREFKAKHAAKAKAKGSKP